MSAPVIGRIPYRVMYYSSLDVLTTPRQNTDINNESSHFDAAAYSTADTSSPINITPAIETINVSMSMNAPIKCIIKIRGNDIPRLYKIMVRGFMQVQFGSTGISGSMSSRTRLFAVTKMTADTNVETGSVAYIYECESITSAYSPMFSRHFPGSLQNIVTNMYDLIYAHKILDNYKPVVDFEGDPVFGAPLLQYQTFDDYIQETKEYAVSDDMTPYWIWEDFSSLRGSSIAELLKQKPIHLIVTSTQRIGEGYRFPLTDDNGTVVGYYVEDFRNELLQDTKKLQKLERVMYNFPKETGGSVNYSTIGHNQNSTTEVAEIFETINSKYDFNNVLKDGRAEVIRKHLTSMMEIGMASFVYYQDDLFINPGDIVMVHQGNTNIIQRQYLVWSVLATSSNKNGYQQVELLDIEPLAEFINQNKSTNSTQFFNEAFGIHEND